ncbi:MAG: hypothetical protein A3H71_00415 [Candidatus Sungbacteria bacterium RIFCSPLOWO2_02_FULL_48_13b]|uniref:Antitoxin n=2 Tax=Candidatus Sungiibacteriota TaxID=1817917 RepID=A0A1G2LEG1_9BACT|nr:MAG: hypothetical protein A3C12_03065 [Candidatus Sungbacteria bacterium RIFCSPHIGHO2_02_FULL_49_20]OHA10006.1 MAG: hypothetical protein A3H71_00415 [Candidatus Sungbacteria bacterium RIFCSPLOWO2_02_FULL_48_13b]
MDFRELKNWITDANERLLIVEDGEPVAVVMSFEAYRALKGHKAGITLSASHPMSHGDEPLIRANAELEAERVRAQQELATKMAMDTDALETPRRTMRDPAEIRLEDLPL